MGSNSREMGKIICQPTSIFTDIVHVSHMCCYHLSAGPTLSSIDGDIALIEAEAESQFDNQQRENRHEENDQGKEYQQCAVTISIRSTTMATGLAALSE